MVVISNRDRCELIKLLGLMQNSASNVKDANIARRAKLMIKKLTRKKDERRKGARPSILDIHS